MISVNYVNVPRVEGKTELVFSPTSCTKLTVFQPGSIVILIEPHCSGHVSPIPGLTCLLIDRSNVVQASCSHTNLLCETLLYYIVALIRPGYIVCGKPCSWTNYNLLALDCLKPSSMLFIWNFESYYSYKYLIKFTVVFFGAKLIISPILKT